MVGCGPNHMKKKGFCCRFFAESLAWISINCLPGRLGCSCDSAESSICRANIYYIFPTIVPFSI